MEVSGILLMLLLGLRHGFDPDHIAIIDSVGVRYMKFHPGLAKWTGTLFAAGHGSVVTAIAVMISIFSHSWNFSARTWAVLEWLPGIILIAVGLINLRMLLTSKVYQPRGVKMFFLPKKLQNSTHPLAIVLIGALFAMVFDTNTQAAAWAYTASGRLSVPTALILGTAFSAGMILTDTVDSRILFLLMSRSAENNTALVYRRKLGFIIVIVSLAVGIYKSVSILVPSVVLDDHLLTIIGILFFVFLVAFYLRTLKSDSPKLNKQVNGN